MASVEQREVQSPAQFEILVTRALVLLYYRCIIGVGRGIIRNVSDLPLSF
jgi:hypothetical protein